MLVAVTAILLAILFLLSRKRRHPPILTVGSPFEREVSENEFETLVVEKSRSVPVLVDFYATWCRPCQFLTPLLAQIAQEYDGAFLLAKIDGDKNSRLIQSFGISAFPTVALFKNGEAVESFTGGRLEHSIRYKLAQHEIQAPGDRS